jgi:hypothetical protein
MVMALCYGREALWRSVVEIKYDSLRGGWGSKEIARPWECGNISGGGGKCSLDWLDMRCEMDLR